MTLTLILPPDAAADTRTSLTVGIVASKTLELYPLKLRERDMVSMMNLVYEGLFYLDDDEYPQPDLCESYEWAGDGKRLDIRLRQNVTFHNGKKLTAEDVCATLDMMLALSGFDDNRDSEIDPAERGLYASCLTYISSWNWSESDPYTVQIVPRYPSYEVFYALTFPILPAEEVDLPQPSGTGPYKIEEYDPGYRLWISSYSGWWQRAPQIVDIEAIIYEDTDGVLSAFEYQDVDVTMTRSISATRYSGSLNSYMLTYRTRQLEVLFMNLGRTLFQNQDVRTAICMALDRDAIIKSVYQNMAISANSLVMSGTWLYEEDAAQPLYNPTAAKALLDGAGYKLVDKGDGSPIYRYKNGDPEQPLSFRLLTYDEPGSTVRRNAAANIKSMLAEVGIKVSVEVWSYDNVKAKLKSGDYWMVLGAYNLDVIPDPSFMLNSAVYGAAYSRYRDETMVGYLKDLRSAKDADAFQKVMSDIQNKFVVDLPFIAMYWRTGALLSRDSFTNARDIRELELLRGVEEWYY